MLEAIFTTFLLIFILWVLFSYHKTRERSSRSVNMAVFLINNPEDFISQSGLLDVFRHLHQEKWNRWLLGDPYIALEKVVTPQGFKRYIAIPASCSKVLEGRPDLLKVEDAAIPRNKFYSAAYLNYLPKRINFENPRLHEDEGASLQILVRHRHSEQEQGIFESNLELLVWADSQRRAYKVLGAKSTKTAIFDFSRRIFENRKRVRISFKELKNIFLA